MGKWQTFINSQVTERGYVRVKAEIFGNHVTADNMWKWTTNRAAPKKIYADLVMDLVSSGYLPSESHWKTRMRDILAVSDIRKRAEALGISSAVVATWMKGATPVQKWVIPYLAEAIRRTTETDTKLRRARDRMTAKNAKAIVSGGKVSDRDRRMVEMYHGLDGKGRHSLEDVAEAFGITRQRVHAIFKRVGVGTRPMSLGPVRQEQEQSEAH